MEAKYKHVELTEKIIQAFYEVYNLLGYGFSEKVYENALAIKLEKYKLDGHQQNMRWVSFLTLVLNPKSNAKLSTMNAKAT